MKLNDHDMETYIRIVMGSFLGGILLGMLIVSFLLF